MISLPLQSDVDTFAAEVFFQVRYSDFSEVEDAGSKGCICLSQGEGITEMLHLAGTTRSDNRNTYFFGKTGEGFVGESLFDAVVIHTGGLA